MLEEAPPKPYLNLNTEKESIFNRLFFVEIIYTDRLFKRQVPDFRSYF